MTSTDAARRADTVPPELVGASLWRRVGVRRRVSKELRLQDRQMGRR